MQLLSDQRNLYFSGELGLPPYDLSEFSIVQEFDDEMLYNNGEYITSIAFSMTDWYGVRVIGGE